MEAKDIKKLIIRYGSMKIKDIITWYPKESEYTIKKIVDSSDDLVLKNSFIEIKKEENQEENKEEQRPSSVMDRLNQIKEITNEDFLKNPKDFYKKKQFDYNGFLGKSAPTNSVNNDASTKEQINDNKPYSITAFDAENPFEDKQPEPAPADISPKYQKKVIEKQSEIEKPVEINKPIEIEAVKEEIKEVEIVVTVEIEKEDVLKISEIPETKEFPEIQEIPEIIESIQGKEESSIVTFDDNPFADDIETMDIAEITETKEEIVETKKEIIEAKTEIIENKIEEAIEEDEMGKIKIYKIEESYIYPNKDNKYLESNLPDNDEDVFDIFSAFIENSNKDSNESAPSEDIIIMNDEIDTVESIEEIIIAEEKVLENEKEIIDEELLTVELNQEVEVENDNNDSESIKNEGPEELLNESAENTESLDLVSETEANTIELLTEITETSEAVETVEVVKVTEVVKIEAIEVVEEVKIEAIEVNIAKECLPQEDNYEKTELLDNSINSTNELDVLPEEPNNNVVTVELTNLQNIEEDVEEDKNNDDTSNIIDDKYLEEVLQVINNETDEIDIFINLATEELSVVEMDVNNVEEMGVEEVKEEAIKEVIEENSHQEEIKPVLVDVVETEKVEEKVNTAEPLPSKELSYDELILLIEGYNKGVEERVREREKENDGNSAVVEYLKQKYELEVVDNEFASIFLLKGKSKRNETSYAVILSNLTESVFEKIDTLFDDETVFIYYTQKNNIGELDTTKEFYLKSCESIIKKYSKKIMVSKISVELLKMVD